MSDRTPVTLCMIVKNEERVISRALATALPHIDSYAIHDTGSTDNTKKIIAELLKDKPGCLIDSEWVDFATNRNQALETATLTAAHDGYILFLDADDMFIGPALPALTADTYRCTRSLDGLKYGCVALVAARLNWRWVGVLHEYVECVGHAASVEHLPEHLMMSTHDGVRSADPDKFLKDAATLEKALKDDPDNSRYVFYLAQSYKDAGKLRKAAEIYQRRARMGGWEEEIWFSLYETARLAERTNAEMSDVMGLYLTAWVYRPVRAEPLAHLARYLATVKGEPLLASIYADKAATIPYPTDTLFVEPACYILGKDTVR